MSELTVTIVRLAPMKVASAHGFGKSPEAQAWGRMLAWAKPAGILEAGTHRFFGFNNPSPSPGSPNYGYEQWMTVNESITVDDPNITLKDFAGGLYAVARCKLPDIGPAWQQLVAWREDNAYQPASHQWLEEAITPPGIPFEDFVMDLYLPIAE